MTNSRAFWPVLLAIAFIGLIIRVEVGRNTFISFDEWQHVFMASSARWADLSFELRTNAHPPLFFLLLKGIVRLGNVAFYRCISIASGVGSIIIIGLIARKVIQSPVIQLLCAAAFALSADAISISVEIRSYQLAVFLSLLAFLYWLDMFPDSDGTVPARSCIAFAIFASLAVSSHYSVAFFLGACLIVSLLLIALPQRRNRTMFDWKVAAALAVPCAVFAVEYFVHASVQPIQGYLFDYYRGLTPNETVVSFVVRNAGNFFNLFSPIQLRSPLAFVPAILLLTAAATWAVLRQLRAPLAQPLPAAAILFAVVTILGLLAASLAQKYPFGGLLRHEYIAGPFVLIAVFVNLDTLLPLTNAFAQRAIPAFLLAISVTNLIVEGRGLILYPGTVLLKTEFDEWRAAVPETPAVYLDHWSVIGYFIHTSDRPRYFVRRIPDDAIIDEYRVPAGATGVDTEIFYDKTRSIADPYYDDSVYGSIAACLRNSGVKELSLLFYSPGDKPIDHSDLEAVIIRKATEQGLETTKVAVGRTSLVADFKLR